jgi:transcriptional regulator with XRE-family HTH domain
MPFTVSDRAVERSARRMTVALGEDIRRLREDAGVTRAELARAAGVDASYLRRIEAGTVMPSAETVVRLSLALGADPSLRLYPSTGSPIRDRHQAAIASALLASLHPRWRAYPEVAVRRPARGWIDLGLHDAVEPTFIATEIQSDLRRLEQLVRWSQAKADSLPSWDGWAHLGGELAISRLLLIRETRANRSIVATAGPLLRAAYPANGHVALESLTRGDSWPGPALLWAARDRRRPGTYRLVVRS